MANGEDIALSPNATEPMRACAQEVQARLRPMTEQAEFDRIPGDQATRSSAVTPEDIEGLFVARGVLQGIRGR